MIVAAGKASDAASSPIRPPGGWEVVLVATAIAAFVVYICLLVVLRRSGPFVPILALAVALQLLPLLGPTLLSRDAYTYWAYGRVGAVYDANPYADAPALWPDDPATVSMGSSWRQQPSLYGPVFTVASEVVAEVAGDSPSRASLFFRSLAALSVVAIVGLAVLLARDRAFAAAFVGLNPLVALHFAGGGHNDAPMIALVLAALVLERSRRHAASGLAWAVSALVKWVSLSFLALVVIGARRRNGFRLLAWSAGWLLALALAATALYGTAWLDAAGRLSEQARRTGSIGLSDWLGDLGLSHRPTVVVIGLLTLAVALWLALQAWRGHVRLGLAGVLLAALQGWLNPWYALWGLALAAPEDDRTAHVLAVALSGFLLFDALPV
jgi:alpha-1,6-mannosyltransferase